MNSWITTILCTLDGTIESITMDDKENIYYTTGWKGKLEMISHKTKEKKELAFIEDSDLRGITWHESNILFICDFSNHKILLYSLITREISTMISSSGTLDGPWGIITADSNSDLYITDRNYIRKIQVGETSRMDIIAGSASGWKNRGYTDGQAKTAKFTVPSGLSMGADGAIYVADFSNHCIRKIKDGFVSTVAGHPERAGHRDGSLQQAKFNKVFGVCVDIDGSLLVCDSNSSDSLRRIDMNQNKVTSLGGFGNGRIYSLYMGPRGIILLGRCNELIKVERTWCWERYLWIGYMKEDSSYCLLAAIPKEIIQEIASHISPKDTAMKTLNSCY